MYITKMNTLESFAYSFIYSNVTVIFVRLLRWYYSINNNNNNIYVGIRWRIYSLLIFALILIELHDLAATVRGASCYTMYDDDYTD